MSGDQLRVAWFSAGVSSLIAAYFARPDKIIYIDIDDQHPDSMRFVRDAERVLGVEIEIIIAFLALGHDRNDLWAQTSRP